jgi:tRNA (cmo5U34)-methyltransferase
MSIEERDELFREPRTQVEEFAFSDRVAAVFDDMLARSVPFYAEIQRMLGELTVNFAVPGTAVFDLGCSTGASLLHLDPSLPDGVDYVGVDHSEAMLNRCRARFTERGIRRRFALRRTDLNQGLAIENASVVLLVLTLQFLRPPQREPLIAQIYQGLNDNGCLLLVEKVCGDDPLFDRQFADHHFAMKRRNGYSTLEIAQKREALEKVLVPYTLQQNRRMLEGVGFRRIEVFFKWYNFCGIVALK